MSPRSCSLPKQPVLICPNEVEAAEDSGQEKQEESVPLPDVALRAVAVPETPSAEDHERHELTHLSMHAWYSVCVRAKEFDVRHLRRSASECAEDQGADHMQIIQFEHAYLSSGDAEGQQVKMSTISDSSASYGTACAIDVKGARGQYAISSAV